MHVSDRAHRNNPGNLRPRREGSVPWPGQDGIKDLAGENGGPFAMFVTVVDGWAALGLWCLDARYLRGMRTATEILKASAFDAGATGAVAAEAVISKDDLNLGNPRILEMLCKVVARSDGDPDTWPQPHISAGMRLCDLRWPHFRALRLAENIPAAPAP